MRVRRHDIRNTSEREVSRVAAYLRVSTEEQAESGLGLGDQRRRCEAMAAAKGWPEPMIFADEGISGTKDTDKRPALRSMLEAVKRGEVDAVIVLSLDRLGRRTRLVLDLVELLTYHGAALVSCKEQLDTSTAQGQFVLTMFAALAQLERDLISERTVGALAELSRREGETGGRMPYGYQRITTNNGRHSIDFDHGAAKVVKHIFALHRRGDSTRTIAERLQEAGHPSPRGKAVKWSHTSVAYILNNSAVYYGGKRGTSSNNWPAILGRAAKPGQRESAGQQP